MSLLFPSTPNKKSVDNLTNILIFPKMFEMMNFFKSVMEKSGKIKHYVYQSEPCFLVSIFVGSTSLKFITICMVESDVSFSFKFGILLRKFDTSKLHIVLCGSCGGSLSLDHKLGQVFRVNKAIKIDRGELNMNDKFEITMTPLKEKSVNSSHPGMVINGVTTLCSNHVMNFDPVNLRVSNERLTGEILDMETYEFYKTCEDFGVERYDCLRVVSDIEGLKVEIHCNVSHSSLKKKIRKRVNLVLLLEEVKSIVYCKTIDHLTVNGNHVKTIDAEFQGKILDHVTGSRVGEMKLCDDIDTLYLTHIIQVKPDRRPSELELNNVRVRTPSAELEIKQSASVPSFNEFQDELFMKSEQDDVVKSNFGHHAE